MAAFAGGSVLVIGAVAALHNLYRSGDDAAALIGWAGLLLLALTALGGGIKLAMWGARPAVTAFFDRAKDLCAEPVQAVAASGAVIVGALGMWWTFRGGYTSWWQHLTGESQWSLSLGVGQMLVAVVAGAALFNGGRYVTGLAKEALTDSGLLIERDRAAGRRRAPEGLWHPGLVAALIGGGLGLVLLTAGITPRLYVWITGPDVLPAVAAITAVLLWAIGSNLGWWKGLVGLWKWASDASQTATATAGVVAVLMFSASGLGLGWFTPATVPQARAACPPDCGGPGGSDGPPGGGQMFQPPSQGGPQMPDYQGGINQPPMDQNSGISIYNTQAPSAGDSTGSQGAQQGSQQGWDQPAHGTQIPDYQNATPYTQGPGVPNPEYNGGQANPGSQGGQPNQGVQQPVQQPQQASQQPGQDQLPQNNSGQQPNQSSDQQKIDGLTRQLQQQQQQSGQDRQRIDDLTKQLQQQKQNKQQSPKFPSKDKKKDEQDDRDKQSGDNDLSALLLGAASTRRRKQDDQQGPDTEALGQDASQAVQGLPGDVQTYVQSGQQIGESSGQAAQGFGSAAQAGASLASSAQSGAVNPQDAINVVQGVSQGIQGTADAVNAGSQIVKTAQGEADQVAQAVGDANPQLKPQTEQFTQLNDQASQVTDLVGQGSQLTSQGAGAVNSAMSGAPDFDGTATAVNGPGDVHEPPIPNSDLGSLSSIPGVRQAQPQQTTPPDSNAPRAERGFMDGMGKRWSETWRGAASLVGLGGEGAPGVADAWKGAIQGHVKDVFAGPMTPFVGPIFLANNLTEQAMASDNAADFAGQQTTDLAIMATSLIPGIGSAGRVLSEAGVAGRAATIGSEATRLTETATRYHSALDSIAQNMRTTGAMSTREGTDLIASGKRDLTPAQRALVQPGEQLAKNPSLHAETTLIEAAKAAGLTPQQVAVTRLICPGCTTAIVESGGEILPGGLGAVWPK
ncbi:YIP1 family protein [Mycobacteroides saopaulense]|uniref:YIP1 family protein n=1 Tax=Mycobacteroides saopaulense TaxID=1578165 RepID=A0A1X0J9C1_9MYCO|nr:YIP1 family protein [Mycobacteroides saopaulense]